MGFAAQKGAEAVVHRHVAKNNQSGREENCNLQRSEAFFLTTLSLLILPTFAHGDFHRHRRHS